MLDRELASPGPGPADWEAMQLMWFATSQLSSGNYEIGPASTGDMYESQDS